MMQTDCWFGSYSFRMRRRHEYDVIQSRNVVNDVTNRRAIRTLL